EFKETLVEASVTVVGTKTSALTDVEGRFRLELPPGTYSLRVSYELHKPARIDDVTVQAGQVLRVDMPLNPDKDAVDVFEVVEEADKTSLEGLILARQKANVVGDSVGRAEISKTPDRNAAQAAQRVVGATVVGGRFVYVRGLGERYTNALIDGAPLPSPEPDRAAVPLDLFPTGVLNSITIAKTFTPDYPGDFAGGSVRIETREIPKEPLFQLSARAGYNTNSTGRTRLDYRGGGTDWLGIDDGTRALPEGFPSEFIGDTYPPEQRTQAGRALNSYMSTQDKGTPPDHSFGVVAGNGWDLGNDRKLGAIGGVSWGRGYTVRRGEIIRVLTPAQPGEDEYHVARDYVSTVGNMNVNWGAFGSLTYRFNPRHQLSLTGLRSTLADDRTQVITGTHDVREANIYATRLQFVTRALNMGLLRGEHRFPELDHAELDWNLALSSAVREEPDRRDTVWQDGRSTPEQRYAFANANDSGRHFYADQTERQYGGGLDWTQPIGARDSKLKGGGLFSLRNRDFWSRALTIGTRRGAQPNTHSVLSCPSGDIDACNDTLFVPENIGHEEQHALELAETRTDGDQYKAKLNVFAGYLMTDLGLSGDLRILLGERVEYTYQTIEATNQNGVFDPDLSARIAQTDLLPAATATYSITTKSKLRAAATRTLARPQLRELSPFTYQDYFGGRVEGGN
ncbi:MAG TPA: carboxypeptidase regulatory-like domain-containing protein, partial [Polyangiaceae bacterium]